MRSKIMLLGRTSNQRIIVLIFKDAYFSNLIHKFDSTRGLTVDLCHPLSFLGLLYLLKFSIDMFWFRCRFQNRSLKQTNLTDETLSFVFVWFALRILNPKSFCIRVIKIICLHACIKLHTNIRLITLNTLSKRNCRNFKSSKFWTYGSVISICYEKYNIN